MGEFERLAAAAALAVALMTAAGAAAAEEARLRAVTGFQPGTRFSAQFEKFVDKVNEDGKGVVQIQLVGGPGAVPPMEQGNAVRTGVVDIANVPGAYYVNLVPEADALKLATRPMAEQRENGGWELVNRIHNERMNVQYLARTGTGIPFHFFFREPVDNGFDFDGLRVRVTPVTRDVVAALGGVPVTTAPGEVFTAMERGVVDGYGWPVQGIFDLGWQEVTGARLDPGFYSVEVNILVNLDAWNRLDDDQRRVLQEAALWVEGLDAGNAEENEAEKKRQAEAGIQTITVPAQEAEAFAEKAREIGWNAVIERSPEHGPRLRELLDR
ncbi:TRAP transporter substrate-binding protein DctP [Arenibaculum sp.]|jgi:TRAP-type C4-dicarboxylate transport system substrate-binding protein|uniref:TRAP transporter substrate-binding protein DctP n=1 Tax=Arenibaculum sp. TaxID=2865862 RepID=UPI002E0DA817|nr:TRAP transporter substrate-binding protein DctP [Arenibaculum sp.]